MISFSSYSIFAEVPQYLLESSLIPNNQKIAVTQPRRISATSIAQRVAEEQRCELGTTVGYCVRFDDQSSSQTRIKFFTDGMLLRELLRDPHLTDYSVVVIDEAHERTLRTDMLLCILRQLQLARTKGLQKAGSPIGSGRPPPLKLVIMSASLDADRFSQYFDGCVPARTHTKPDCLQVC